MAADNDIRSHRVSLQSLNAPLSCNKAAVEVVDVRSLLSYGFSHCCNSFVEDMAEGNNNNGRVLSSPDEVLQ